MFIATPLIIIIAGTYFLFSKKSFLSFFLFSLIFTNFFIIQGYHLMDEILLFIFLAKIIFSSYDLNKNLKNNYLQIYSDLKRNNKITLKSITFFLLIIFFIYTTINGIIFYDFKVIRFSLLFLLILLFYLFKKQIFSDKLNLNTCLDITLYSIFSLILFLIQGLYLEIFELQNFSRYSSQGSLVAGSSIALSIFIFTTLPAIAIFDKYRNISICYFVLAITVSYFYDSRLGLSLLTAFILINFYKKFKLMIFLIIIPYCLSMILDFFSYNLKYKRVFANYISCIEESNNKKDLNCDLQFSRNNIFLRSIDMTLYLNNFHKNIPLIENRINQIKLKKSNHIKKYEKDNQIVYKNNFKDLLKFNKKEKLRNYIIFIKTLDLNNISGNSNKYLNKNSNIKTKSKVAIYKRKIKENIFLNPSVSDFGRRFMVVGAIEHMNSSSLYNFLFGHGFYSHKSELVKTLNSLLEKRDIKGVISGEDYKNYKKKYVQSVQYPVRTANLPAFIVDGGLILIILIFLFYVSIAVNILKKLKKSKKINLFLNQSLIVGSIFLMNYINFNIDLVFLWIILLHVNYLTEFSINE